MPDSNQTRTYERSQCIVFLKTKEKWGGLSNMAGGFPLQINDICILTSEALYQACRFPHLPKVQELILSEKSPMTAKMRGKPFTKDSRPDWEHVRVRIMRWCLRAKLAQNWQRFGDLLLKTGDKPIVEQSRRDRFWGAVPVDDEILAGQNVLGRLLMELREELKCQNASVLRTLKPLSISKFLLLNCQIEEIGRSEPTDYSNIQTKIYSVGEQQSSLFEVAEESTDKKTPRKVQDAK